MQLLPSREVVYLNELDLRGFEANRGIARHCKVDGVPSIWMQAPHEDEKKLTRSRARRDQKDLCQRAENSASGSE